MGASIKIKKLKLPMGLDADEMEDLIEDELFEGTPSDTELSPTKKHDEDKCRKIKALTQAIKALVDAI